jgi:hypothetical protein
MAFVSENLDCTVESLSAVTRSAVKRIRRAAAGVEKR